MMNREQQTLKIYSELQEAYDFFNQHLFDNKLPDCIITLQREKNTAGYYSKKRFVNHNSETICEIALNPSYFAIRTIEETLSTLCHEQSHLWQAAFGKPGRGGYHNKEWAAMMINIGLMPSDTGLVGGKTTGDRMTHYIIEGGRFEEACKELITSKYRLSWADRFPPRMQALMGFTGDQDNSEGNENPKPRITWELEDNSDNPESNFTFKTPKKTRNKFTCPKCNANAWGSPSLSIICGVCNVAFLNVDDCE
jgi:predicted SprT family Zn-dependent metalloprotease